MENKLFYLILGCAPKGRNTEQHDAFFGIGTSLKDLIPQMESFWPGAGKIHIDSWREVTAVDGYAIKIIPKEKSLPGNEEKLFFLNLGGYKPGDMEEYHYKLLTVSGDKSEAVRNAKKTAFFLHTGFKGATSHIDDKYGVDVDDVYEITDILSPSIKDQFTLVIEKAGSLKEDELHIGYVKLGSL
ncbi:MAG TPA: DUF1543 domain-containing protein [Ferruginibacter sp.]|nr:DUF1543 domain-containing protein [Ferruginibacter sp.]